MRKYVGKMHRRLISDCNILQRKSTTFRNLERTVCNISKFVGSLTQLHLHTGDVSEVYQYIPPECLPKDYGGELDDVETLHGNVY